MAELERVMQMLGVYLVKPVEVHLSVVAIHLSILATHLSVTAIHLFAAVRAINFAVPQLIVFEKFALHNIHNNRRTVYRAG